jgi:hypothetical protein
MAYQASELRAAVEAFLADQDGRARYQRAQLEMTGGRGMDASRPRPLEFDERGFPISQKGSGFAKRVARLLDPL